MIAVRCLRDCRPQADTDDEVSHDAPARDTSSSVNPIRPFSLLALLGVASFVSCCTAVGADFQLGCVLRLDSIKEMRASHDLRPRARVDVPDPPAEANGAAHALRNGRKRFAPDNTACGISVSRYTGPTRYAWTPNTSGRVGESARDPPTSSNHSDGITAFPYLQKGDALCQSNAGQMAQTRKRADRMEPEEPRK